MNANAVLSHWAKQFARWLRSLLGLPNASAYVPERLSPPRYAPDRALYHYRDERILGCVECWNLVHRDSNSQLLIVLVSLAQLRQELGTLHSSAFASDCLQSWQRDLGRDLDQQLQAQADVLGTHLWFVGWKTPRSGRDSQGRAYTHTSVHALGAWVVNLEGALRGNYPAKEVTARIVRTLFHLQIDPGFWQQTIERIRWLKWLEEAAIHVISPTTRSHVLQPPHPRRR